MSRPKKGYLMVTFKFLLWLCILSLVIVLIKLPTNKYNSTTKTKVDREAMNNINENQSILNNRRIKMTSFYEVSESAIINLTTALGPRPKNLATTKASFKATLSTVRKKIILFWDEWFTGEWNTRFRDQDTLENTGCPSFNCEFTYDRGRLKEANAILLLRSKLPNISHVHNKQRSTQRWIIVDVEAPTRAHYKTEIQYKSALNWTATYHSSSDILAFYGFFTPYNYTVRALRPNFMDYESDTMKAYLYNLSSKEENKAHVDDFLPTLGLPSLTSRNRTAAWMSSHCPTYSRRETLVKKLQQYIEIDTYGSCGNFKCGPKRSPYNPECWQKTIAPKYLFYLSFENRLCDEYITEKLYIPLFYGLVPVVYGGANYSQFLPPHSYIDASHYSPDELAKLIRKVQSNPQLYRRYHLWRKFWKVHIGGSFCELCYKLETDDKTSQLANFRDYRDKNEKCYPTKL